MDTDPVRYALNKWYSKSTSLQDVLEELHWALEGKPVRLRYVRIPGKDLVADLPSRGFYAYEDGMNEKEAWRKYVSYSGETNVFRSKREVDVEIERRKRISESVLLSALGDL
jgi:hypothetical protein